MSVEKKTSVRGIELECSRDALLVANNTLWLSCFHWAAEEAWTPMSCEKISGWHCSVGHSRPRNGYVQAKVKCQGCSLLLTCCCNPRLRNDRTSIQFWWPMFAKTLRLVISIDRSLTKYEAGVSAVQHSSHRQSFDRERSIARRYNLTAVAYLGAGNRVKGSGRLVDLYLNSTRQHHSIPSNL